MKDHVISAHSRSFDLFASLASLAVAAAAGYALLRPDSAVHRGQNLSPPVATLERVESLVRIKGSEAPVWDEARGRENLHDADQVFTDAGSGAVLRFVDDVTVELGEHTLVAVERQTAGERPMLNILSGTLRAKAPPGAATLVKVGRDTIVAAAAGTEFTVESSRSGAAEVRVSKGSLEVSSPSSKVQVSSGSAADVAANGTMAAAVMPAVLTSPAHAAEFTDGQAIQLAWRASQADDLLVVEVARDAAFAQLITHATVAGSDYALPSQADGTYYWRVKAASQPERQSEVRRLTIKTKPVLRLTWPPDGHVHKTDANTGPVDVLLAWSHTGAEPVSVIIERNGVAEPFWRREVSSDNTQAGGLPAGSYTWRVEHQGQTAIGHFRIEAPAEEPKAAPAPLAPPSLKPRYEIEVPEGNDSGWLWRLFEDVAYAEDDLPGRPIAWDAVPGAAGYRVHIASDKAGETVVWRQDTPDPSIKTPRLKAGTYYLRIATLDTSGIAGPFSPPSELIVKVPAAASVATAAEPRLKAPELIAPVSDQHFSSASDTLPVSLKWQAVKGAANYELEVLTDTKTVFTRRTRGQDATAPLPLGAYAWRARALPRDGEPGPWSKSIPFAILKPPAVATPVFTPVAPEPAPAVPAGVVRTPPDLYVTWLYEPSAWTFDQTGPTATKLRAKLFNVQSLVIGYRFVDDWSIDVALQRLSTEAIGHQLTPTNGHALVRYGFGYAWYVTVGAGYGWHEVPVFASDVPGVVSLHQAATKGPALGMDLSWRWPDATPLRLAVNALQAGADKRGEVAKVTAWRAALSSDWRLTDHVWTNVGVSHGNTHADLTGDTAAIDQRLTSLALGLTLTP